MNGVVLTCDGQVLAVGRPTHHSNGGVQLGHAHATGEATVVALVRRDHFLRVVKVTGGLRRVRVQVNQLVTCGSVANYIFSSESQEILLIWKTLNSCNVGCSPLLQSACAQGNNCSPVTASWYNSIILCTADIQQYYYVSWVD